MAQEGRNSARTGGAEEGNIIVTKRSRRDSVLFDDKVQTTIETEASILLEGKHTHFTRQTIVFNFARKLYRFKRKPCR